MKTIMMSNYQVYSYCYHENKTMFIYFVQFNEVEGVYTLSTPTNGIIYKSCILQDCINFIVIDISLCLELCK